MEFAILLLLHTVGFAGGVTLRKVKFPAGAMVGAFVFTAILSVACGFHTVPKDLRPYVQMLSGAVIGSRIRRENLIQFKSLWRPALLFLPGMLLLNLCFGILMTLIGGLDLTTALFGSAPGGVADMALIADDLGANSSQVVVLQFFRLLTILLCFPPLFKHIFSKNGGVTDAPVRPDSGASISVRTKTLRFGGTILCALAGGLVFRQIGFPAGMMVGAVFAVTLNSLILRRSWVPQKMAPVVQMLSGVYLGSQFTRETLFSIQELLIPILLIVLEVFTMAFSLGYLLHKVTKLPLGTALFACSPGGLSDMALLAEDLGVDSASVTVLQTCRLLCVLGFFPLMIRFVTQFFLR